MDSPVLAVVTLMIAVLLVAAAYLVFIRLRSRTEQPGLREDDDAIKARVAAKASRSSYLSGNNTTPAEPAAASPSQPVRQSENKGPPEAREVAESWQSVSRTEAQEEQLSQSGVITLESAIDMCLENQNYEDAIKWAEHAINTSPNRYELQVKLAEIYLKVRNGKGFVRIFEHLAKKLDKTDKNWLRIERIAKRVIPKHPALR